MKSGRQNVNIKALAERCGVSIGSVDRALHNRPGINALTRKRIIDKAKELRYRPNLPARSLVMGTTKTVGIVVFDLVHAFFSQLVTAAISRLRQEGYFASVAVSEKERAEERKCLEQMSSLDVDGIIVFPMNKGREFDAFLKGLHKPIVTVGNLVSQSWPYVGVDYEKASFDAVAYIASRGYRRIVYLCPPLATRGEENRYAVEMRAAGYARAMRTIPGLDKPKVISGPGYLAHIDRLEFGTASKTAILCSSDIYALKILTYLTKKGIRIPEDVGLMGFDNIDTLQYVHPTLATVDCLISEIGSRAAECLLKELSGEYLSPVIGHRIIAGETL